MEHHHHRPACSYQRSIVPSIWQIDGKLPFLQETILPKGVIEIIFNFNETEKFTAGIEGRQYDLKRVFINGYNTQPIVCNLPERHCLLGIQLGPAAVRHFLHAPAGEFCNSIQDLATADGGLCTLWHQLAEKKNFEERVPIILAWMQHKRIHIHPQEQYLNSLLAPHHQLPESVAAMAREACYSPRHLSRKMYELTKMNTEEVLLYKKYLHAVSLMYATNMSLTAIAHQSNFTDQSHFIRTFKSFTQITPGAYRKAKTHVPGHLFLNVR